MIPPWLSPVSLIIAGSTPIVPALETGQLGNDEGYKKEGHAKGFSDTVTWDGCHCWWGKWWWSMMNHMMNHENLGGTMGSLWFSDT